MDGFFWTSYGLMAGLALGLGALAIGLLAARERLGARAARAGRSKILPPARR